MKNSNDRIEPANFQLGAQCLNRLRHLVSVNVMYVFINKQLTIFRSCFGILAGLCQ
jgi:hypothetical protein